MAEGNVAYKNAKFDGAAGDVSVVAGVAGTKIQLHAAVISFDTADAIFRWEDGAGGTALSGLMENTIDTTVVLPFSEVPWFVTTAGNALSIEATTSGVGGHVIYSEAT